MKLCWACRHTTPATTGHQAYPTEGILPKPTSATVVDVPYSTTTRRQAKTSRPLTKPRASPEAGHRRLSERCSSSAQMADANSSVQQGPMIRFDHSNKGAELRELRAASSLDACDMMSEVSQHSNMHGSISLAGNGLGGDDVASSAHLSSISVCVHGDTWHGEEHERAPTQRISARGGIKSRSGAKHRLRGHDDGTPLLQYDAGLRMAMALQAESHGGILPQVAVRGSVKLLQRSSKAFVTDCKAHTRQTAWRAT